MGIVKVLEKMQMAASIGAIISGSICLTYQIDRVSEWYEDAKRDGYVVNSGEKILYSSPQISREELKKISESLRDR